MIPSNWPLKDLPFFEYKGFNKEKNCDSYRVNPSKLEQDKCHMFFPIPLCEELIIATGMEFISFHPLNKEANEKYELVPVQCGHIQLFWCSFPKEFKDVCERMGKVYNMTLKVMPRFMLMGGFEKGTSLQFPSDANLLCFETKNRCHDHAKIEEDIENIKWLGNSFESLSID